MLCFDPPLSFDKKVTIKFHQIGIRSTISDIMELETSMKDVKEDLARTGRLREAITQLRGERDQLQESLDTAHAEIADLQKQRAFLTSLVRVL